MTLISRIFLHENIASSVRKQKKKLRLDKNHGLVKRMVTRIYNDDDYISMQLGIPNKEWKWPRNTADNRIEKPIEPQF